MTTNWNSEEEKKNIGYKNRTLTYTITGKQKGVSIKVEEKNN